MGWRDASGWAAEIPCDKIRHDQPGALRRILEYVRGLEKEEQMARNEDGRQLFKAWVPAFLEEFQREGTRRRYQVAWRHLDLFSGSGMFSIRGKWIITC